MQVKFLSAGALALLCAGCTSDPYAPVNQSAPIRQMDNAFDPAGTRYEREPRPQREYSQPPPRYEYAPSRPDYRPDYPPPPPPRY
jgi:hypothetical protein